MKRLFVGLLIGLALSSMAAAQDCDKIKGLIHRQDKRIKYYVIPSYYLYPLLKLDAKNGDQCFATAQEALAAGYFQLTLTDTNAPRLTPIIAESPSRSITTHTNTTTERTATVPTKVSTAQPQVVTDPKEYSTADAFAELLIQKAVSQEMGISQKVISFPPSLTAVTKLGWWAKPVDAALDVYETACYSSVSGCV